MKPMHILKIAILSGSLWLSLSSLVMAIDHDDDDDNPKSEKICNIYKSASYPKTTFGQCMNYCQELNCADPKHSNPLACANALKKFQTLNVGDPICVAPKRAYITNFNPSGAKANSVTLCTLKPNGSFDSCMDSGVNNGNFDSPLVITLNKNENTAYITNYGNITGNYRVSKCSIETTGSALGQFINPCVDSGAGSAFTHPFGIVLNKNESITYVANNTGNSSVSKCMVTNGSLNACVDSGAGVITGNNGPCGIVLNKTGTLAYVTTDNSNTVMKCTISNGMFTTCTSTGAGFFNGPVGIALNNLGNIAYITNFGNGSGATVPGNTVTICSIDNTGNFTTCKDSGFTFNSPFGVTLNKAGDTAYVVNYSSGLNGTISKCSIDFNPSSSTFGNFKTCSDSGVNSAPFNGPTWVIFSY
ncbi:MAG: beta-propeller fold lactonase family protein [Candidatus Berkiellales bacterium]